MVRLVVGRVAVVAVVVALLLGISVRADAGPGGIPGQIAVLQGRVDSPPGSAISSKEMAQARAVAPTTSWPAPPT